MNLRIADGPGLVRFLHGVISRSQNRVLETGDTTVISVDGMLFYHSSDPMTVGGPFPTLADLLRSEGRRRSPGGIGPNATVRERELPITDVYEWAGSFFTIEPDPRGHVAQHADLALAMERAATA